MQLVTGASRFVWQDEGGEMLSYNNVPDAPSLEGVDYELITVSFLSNALKFHLT
jgi:hypothetical protein